MQDETLTETLSLTDEETPLPEGWRLVRLGDVCYQSKMIIEPSSERAKNLPYLGLESVESGTGKILSSASEVLSDEGKSATFYFNSKHILYGKLRPYLNKVALPDFEGRCTTEMIPLLPTEDAAREYLLLILRRQETVNAVMRETTGSRMPRADMTTLLNLKIPLPPTIEEQRRIAAILDEQMKAVERARLAVEEQLKAACLLPNAFLRSVFESEDAQNWQKRKLGDVCELNPPRSSLSKILSIRTDEMLTSFVPMPAIDGKKGIINKMEIKPFSEVKKGYTVFAEDDVLFAKITPCMQNGKHAIAGNLIDGVGFGSTEFHVIRPENEVISNWIHYFIRQTDVLQDAMKTFTGAVGQQRVPENFLRDLEVPIPQTIEEQKKITEKLNEQMQEVEKLKKTLTEQLEAIKKLPSALLRKAFAGEI